jgi:hypothetical protein
MARRVGWTTGYTGGQDRLPVTQHQRDAAAPTRPAPHREYDATGPTAPPEALMDNQQRVRAIVSRYRDHLARFRALQHVPGSNWSDAMVDEAMRSYRADAKSALRRVGLDADQVAELLADPSPQPRPARTLSEHMNAIIRGGRP